jgi:type II secretory pathway component GspD/PulD (secretin)
MMGGLIDTVRGETHSGIPFLKDIPFIGWLFRSNSNTSGRQELLVLITVHVIDPSSPDSTEHLANRYRAALDEIRHQFKTEGKE